MLGTVPWQFRRRRLLNDKEGLVVVEMQQVARKASFVGHLGNFRNHLFMRGQLFGFGVANRQGSPPVGYHVVFHQGIVGIVAVLSFQSRLENIARNFKNDSKHKGRLPPDDKGNVGTDQHFVDNVIRMIFEFFLETVHARLVVIVHFLFGGKILGLGFLFLLFEGRQFFLLFTDTFAGLFEFGTETVLQSLGGHHFTVSLKKLDGVGITETLLGAPRLLHLNGGPFSLFLRRAFLEESPSHLAGNVGVALLFHFLEQVQKVLQEFVGGGNNGQEVLDPTEVRQELFELTRKAQGFAQSTACHVHAHRFGASLSFLLDDFANGLERKVHSRHDETKVGVARQGIFFRLVCFIVVFAQRYA
mmetsp:Transcript_13794/g.28488  ORF Transcript_13794/g.28488 Transcript_13794/m.28488 type:complete len:359 (-) Transcript_13794:791-1867(-)